MASWYGLLIGGLTLWWTQLPTSVSEGRCEGIGFGCELNPHDTWLFAAFVLGVPGLAVALLASVYMLWRAVARWELEWPWAIGTIAALAGWFAAFVLVCCLISLE
jgi:hypothetical protein